jgi:hypothetical protein
LSTKIVGLSLIAIDGRLVSARRWNCTERKSFFEKVGEGERAAAYAAYERRVFGDGRR